jgi:hypothetical protein
MTWQLATERALTVTHDPIGANTTSEGARCSPKRFVRFAGSCMTVLSRDTFERFVPGFERFEHVPGEPPRDRWGEAASSSRRIAAREGGA